MTKQAFEQAMLSRYSALEKEGVSDPRHALGVEICTVLRSFPNSLLYRIEKAAGVAPPSKTLARCSLQIENMLSNSNVRDANNLVLGNIANELREIAKMLREQEGLYGIHEVRD